MPWSIEEQPLGCEVGGQRGAGKTQRGPGAPILSCGGQNLPGDQASVQRLPQLRKSGSLLKLNWTVRTHPARTQWARGACFEQPLPFFLLDFVTGCCSGLSDFLKLKHLLVFLGKFTLWKRFRQIHPGALVCWV